MHIIVTPFREVHSRIVYVAHQHDEWPLFKIWFSILTIAASIILNMGVFAALVLLHMALDVIKYRTKHSLSWHWVMIETLRESLIDIFFIALGLLLSIAFHHAIAIGGLGRLAEAEVLILNLILRVGPRMKIAEHLLEILLYWKHHFETQFQPRAPLSKSERGMLAAIVIMTIGIIATPFVTSLTVHDVGKTMKKELTPRLEFNILQTIEEIR